MKISIISTINIWCDGSYDLIDIQLNSKVNDDNDDNDHNDDD